MEDDMMYRGTTIDRLVLETAKKDEEDPHKPNLREQKLLDAIASLTMENKRLTEKNADLRSTITHIVSLIELQYGGK